MGKSKRIAVYLFTSLLVSSLAFLLLTSASVPNTHFRNLRVNNVQSLNWAGYVVTSSFSTPTPSVTFVNASWIVQSVSPSSKSTYSSQWAGIGGYFSNDSSLIQTGTESDFASGSATYDAWWELLPSAETIINGFTVRPGDRMWASIALVNSSSNQWQITLQDLTANEIFTNTVTYSSSRLSGEFIEERPAFCSPFSCRLTNLANFGTAYYGSDYTSLPLTEFVTVGTSTNSIGALPNQAITMVSGTGTTLATPSSLTADGTSFSVAYGSSTTISTSTTSTIATTSTVNTSTSLSTTSTTTASTTTVCTHTNPHGKCV